MNSNRAPFVANMFPHLRKIAQDSYDSYNLLSFVQRPFHYELAKLSKPLDRAFAIPKL